MQTVPLDFWHAFTQILVFGYAGILAHILINASAINDNSPTLKFGYVLSRYWQIERFRIAFAVVFISVLGGAADELLPLQINQLVSERLPNTTTAGKITGTLAAFTKILAFLIGLFFDYVIYWLKGKARFILQAEGASQGKSLAEVVKIPDISKNPYAAFMLLAIPAQDYGMFAVSIIMAVLCIIIDWQKAKTSFESAFKDAPLKYVAIALSPLLLILNARIPLWVETIAVCALVYIGFTFIKTVVFKR